MPLEMTWQHIGELACNGAVKHMFVSASISGDICGGSSHVEANHLQLRVVFVIPLCGHGIADIPASKCSLRGGYDLRSSGNFSVLGAEIELQKNLGSGLSATL